MRAATSAAGERHPLLLGSSLTGEGRLQGSSRCKAKVPQSCKNPFPSAHSDTFPPCPTAVSLSPAHLKMRWGRFQTHSCPAAVLTERDCVHITTLALDPPVATGQILCQSLCDTDKGGCNCIATAPLDLHLLLCHMHTAVILGFIAFG